MDRSRSSCPASEEDELRFFLIHELGQQALYSSVDASSLYRRPLPGRICALLVQVIETLWKLQLLAANGQTVPQVAAAAAGVFEDLQGNGPTPGRNPAAFKNPHASLVYTLLPRYCLQKTNYQGPLSKAVFPCRTVRTALGARPLAAMQPIGEGGAPLRMDVFLYGLLCPQNFEPSQIVWPWSSLPDIAYRLGKQTSEQKFGHLPGFLHDWSAVLRGSHFGKTELGLWPLSALASPFGSRSELLIEPAEGRHS